MNKDTMRELIDKLNNATKIYDLGTPIMSDKEWDDLYFELAEQEKELGYAYPDSPTQEVVFSSVSKLSKKTHDHPMLSLDKTKDITVFGAFLEKAPCILMLKIDGLTTSLTYENGELISAETRGNGLVGEDITHNAKIIKNIPHTIPIKEKVVIDGEIICDTETFEKRFKDIYKNPRNYAAGAIRRLDPDPDNGLSFVAWDWIDGPGTTLGENLIKLDSFGFDIVLHLFFYADAGLDLSHVITLLTNMADEFHYPIDGIVAKYDDIKYYQSLGATDHHFKGGFAYKFYDEEYETTLKYIDYDVSRTGILTPVAVFDPVDTGDSIIERASLHNISIMEEVLGKNPYVGQKLVVCKQNMIIPQVVRAEQKTYEELEKENVLFITFKNTVCPICGHSTKIATSDSGVKTLYCSNDNCPGKLAQQIDHYCSKKGLDIKGISRATIEKLIDWGWINSISDIYKLHSHQMEWMDQPGFGKASVFKILDAIDNSKENTELTYFISGLGIPLVGGTIAKIICNYYDTWDDFRAAVGGDWTVFEGIGPEISKAINSFDFTEADKIANIVNFIYSDKNIISNDNNNISNKIFCVTGKLKTFRNRDEIKKDIESLGGKVTDSISAKTNYLINNDIESTSSKNKKAKELGIPIISEEEYIKLRS